MNFVATKAIQVPNQGVPPDSFIAALVAFGSIAGYYVFARNDNNDIYGIIQPVLAPNGWTGIQQRRAGLLTALLYDAGFESGWSFQEGVDMEPGAGTDRPQSEWEAGAWQVSQNSTLFDRSLLDLVAGHCNGGADPVTFQTAMKTDMMLAILYAAWLFRFDTKWSGPCDSGNLVAAMSVNNAAQAIACMNEFQQLIG